MAAHYEGQLRNLEKDIADFLHVGPDISKRDKSAIRIKLTLNGLARELGLNGSVETFGSFSNGFKTGTSDLDVVFTSHKSGDGGSDRAVSILQKFAENLPLKDLGFTNITKIFQASVPLLKLTDVDSQIEVDLCVNNELGVRNSLLLNTYCKYDRRVLHLGRLVKEWAKKHELASSTDGCLNSYAYMLLVVFFLQSVQPPVVPNLQMLEQESFLVPDRKWGGEDYWETKFKMHVDDLGPSSNKTPIGDLLINFFQFYTRDFDWRRHAVSMRRQEAGKAVDKNSLVLPANEDQWYVEDPFDLKHNLAGKCTRAGKKRILDEMKNALLVLQQTGRFTKCLPQIPSTEFYMKCRISQNVQPPDLLEAFEEFDLVKLHFPKPDGSTRMQAFLQFGDAASRRKAHTKNEKYICDCQLQLHYSSQHSLAEALTQCQFSTYEMASYKMQRQVLEARMKESQYNGGIMKDMDMPQDMAAQLAFQNAAIFGKVPPPPPPQPVMMWEEQKSMMPMAKVDPMQMQMQFWGQQQPQMAMYPPMRPMHPVPAPPPPKVPVAPRKPPEHKEIEKKEIRTTKHVPAVAPPKAVPSVPEVSRDAQVRNQALRPEQSTGQWLEVKLKNEGNQLSDEHMSTVKRLVQAFSKYPSIDKRSHEVKAEIWLDVPVVHDNSISYTPELKEILDKLKEQSKLWT